MYYSYSFFFFFDLRGVSGLIILVLVLVAWSLFAIHANYFYVHRYIDMERSIQTKSGLNLILKCLPASFTRLYIYISQIVYWIELKFYIEILETWNCILINFQVKWSSEIYYFKGLKLVDESCQICQTRSSYTIWDISRATSGVLLLLKLRWKLDISIIPIVYCRLINSFRREKTTCLKSGLKSVKNI